MPHAATIDVWFDLSIDPDKRVPLATIAEFVTDQHIEAKIVEELVEHLDELWISWVVIRELVNSPLVVPDGKLDAFFDCERRFGNVVDGDLVGLAFDVDLDLAADGVCVLAVSPDTFFDAGMARMLFEMPKSSTARQASAVA